MHYVACFANRLKLLVHDGFGIWCAARRLHQGTFVWPRQVPADGVPVSLAQKQFQALVVGLPWQRIEQFKAITTVWQVHPRRTTAAREHVPMWRRHGCHHNERMLDMREQTPVAMLDPGAGKTKRAYVWAYARGAFDPYPDVIYDFSGYDALLSTRQLNRVRGP